MRLEDLYTNYTLLSSEKRREFLAKYYVKRASDMAKPSTYKKSKAVKKKVKALPRLLLKNMSLATREMMKDLDLQANDIHSLRKETFNKGGL